MTFKQNISQGPFGLLRQLENILFVDMLKIYAKVWAFPKWDFFSFMCIDNFLFEDFISFCSMARCGFKDLFDRSQ